MYIAYCQTGIFLLKSSCGATKNIIAKNKFHIVFVMQGHRSKKRLSKEYQFEKPFVSVWSNLLSGAFFSWPYSLYFVINPPFYDVLHPLVSGKVIGQSFSSISAITKDVISFFTLLLCQIRTFKKSLLLFILKNKLSHIFEIHLRACLLSLPI